MGYGIWRGPSAAATAAVAEAAAAAVAAAARRGRRRGRRPLRDRLPLDEEQWGQDKGAF